MIPFFILHTRSSIQDPANISTAEDFYANDYPEEELDSEDEAGGRAYTFQNGEEEEWGIGSGDEEDLGVGMGVGVGVAVDWKGRVLKNAEELDESEEEGYGQGEARVVEVVAEAGTGMDIDSPVHGKIDRVG